MAKKTYFLLRQVLIIIIVIVVIGVISLPKLVKFNQRRMRISEAKAVLETIRDYEEVYRGQFDKYIACSANPSTVPQAQKASWDVENQTGWQDIGFELSNGTYYQYEVVTSMDGFTFTAYARSDLDGDGIMSEISLDQDGVWSMHRQFE